MKNLVVFTCLFFVSYIICGQSKIQHEPEKLFRGLYLENNLSDFIKKHQIQKVLFLRDTILSSSEEFDKNGNSIVHIGLENDFVAKTLNKYDDKNNLIEIKHYNADDSFRYGYYYGFKEGVKQMYKIEDSLLFRRSIHFLPENIKIFSEYNSDGSLKLKNIYVFDDENKYLLETRYNGNIINVQFLFEYIDNKKYTTKIQYDKEGVKFSENRYLDEEILPNDKKIYYYNEKGKLIRINYYDDENRIVKIEFYNYNGHLYQIEKREFTNNQIKNIIKEHFDKQETIKYIYFYDENNLLKTVKKISNDILETFTYKYILH